MAKKYFTDESLSALVNEIKSGDAKSLSSAKSYTDTEIAKKANSSHTHDDRYYTESEVDTALAGKASSTHNHDSAYDTKGAAASALASAKTYADSAATKVKNDLLNGAGTAYDTLKELGDLIDVNVNAIDALETVAAGKADKTHSHAISDVTGLQSALDGKAAASHGTHVTFDSTNKPKMDGAAAFGTSTKVARADHVHPTDTSRAAQTDLDALETVVDGKASASHTHVISDVTNLQASLNAKQPTITGGASTIVSSNLTASRALISNSSGKVAVSTVTSTELEYLDGVTSAIQTQLDGKASSSHNHAASNITSGTLSSDRLPTVPITKGGTGATTASGVLTNLGITATATELNYVDGVTSNIQTQLNNKAASSHTHSYLPLSGGNLTGVLGIGNKYELSPAYNFMNGCLINIAAAKSSTMVAIHVTGNSYSASSLPINSLFQFYDYGDGIIMNCSGVNLGLPLGAMTVYRYNNRLYAHIKQTANYQTLSFTIMTNKSGLTPTVENAAAHTSGYTDLVTITPSNVSFDGHTHKYAGSSSDGGVANSAVKATQDASGNVITSTYATKTELDTAKTNLQTSINGKANTSHTHTIANITNLQSSLDGKANVSHTHNYAGSSSAGGAATSANKVNSSLTIKLNSGTTEGTNMFTFNGSGAKSINITPSSIGAATSSHTHDDRYYTETEIDSKVSTLNTAINGKAASSHTHTIANVTNLQSTLDGKSSISHTHSYAGSTSVGGSANALGVFDTRGVNDTPAEMTNLIGGKGLRLDFKQISTVGLSNGTYAAVMSISPWGDTTNWSGGKNTQIGFCDDGRIQVRKGNGSGWTNWNTLIDSSTIGSQSVNYANSAGSATKATQLTTARTIALGTGVTGTATSFNGTGNITIPVTDVKESYLSWGGKNLSGSVSPIDAACSNLHSANRFSFAKAAGITIEYSTDGSTYSTYNTTDSAKINLVSGIGSGYAIGARTSSTTVNDKLRITLNATNMGVYTRLQKLLINISTNYATGSNVIIEKSMKGSETTFTTVGTYPISGWSGWNSIPIGYAFGGGDTQTYNIANLRLTFGITGVNSSQTSNALTITDIIGIGDTYWQFPSTMAKTGHIYTYDSSQNTTFPASVNAPTFSGSGVATVAEVQDYLGI